MKQVTRSGAPTVIGMVHIPINTILASPVAWRDTLGYRGVSAEDWRLISAMLDTGGDTDNLRQSAATVRSLSFFNQLETQMLEAAYLYKASGFNALMLENVAAPYFVRGDQPPVVYWVMFALANRLRATFPKIRLGIQVLAYSDDWAMDIACRCSVDFIRCESALFEGVRPEGRAPNHGNLAKLYMMRNKLMVEIGGNGAGPQVYVDIQKKHTVFMSALDSLGVWLDNIQFQKLEGIVVTGRATGQPVEENDLRRTREAIEKVKAESQAAVGLVWAPALIVGSGVSADNIGMCKRYADAAIVGSSLKRNGYWECQLDQERVKRFMEAWNA